MSGHIFCPSGSCFREQILFLGGGQIKLGDRLNKNQSDFFTNHLFM